MHAADMTAGGAEREEPAQRATSLTSGDITLHRIRCANGHEFDYPDFPKHRCPYVVNGACDATSFEFVKDAPRRVPAKRRRGA